MKYFQFIRNVVLLVLLGTLAGCQNDELIVDMGQNCFIFFGCGTFYDARKQSRELYYTDRCGESCDTY